MPRAASRRHGGALIITLWVALGIVSIGLYFAHSMSLELKAADNRVAGIVAEQAIEGAARYVATLLSSLQVPARIPEPQDYQHQAVALGDATFWIIGRDDRQQNPTTPYFALTDEASKLNINTATREMLEALPRMTTALAAAIIDWRDSDSTVTDGGAEDETYGRLNPPYRCKNARFESVEELRLVYGADLDMLYGEDINRNGVLDPNENDGDVSPPTDNKDGRLDAGILNFVTVYSRQCNTNADGSTKIDVTQLSAQPGGGAGGPGGGGAGQGGGGAGGQGGGGGTQQLAALLVDKLQFSESKAREAVSAMAPGGRAPTSILEAYYNARNLITQDQFAQIETNLTMSAGTFTEGLVNVNTASETVLACIPGIGTSMAGAVVAYRVSHTGSLPTVAWVADVITDRASLVQAGPHLTGQSYQFRADIAAVGPHGRGYRRVEFIFDTSDPSDNVPKLIHREDLSNLGWALGRDAQQTLLAMRGVR
jgi:DNA uptake protein ComE-like DNA-binding protein